jgi:hypothetical protein
MTPSRNLNWDMDNIQKPESTEKRYRSIMTNDNCFSKLSVNIDEGNSPTLRILRKHAPILETNLRMKNSAQEEMQIFLNESKTPVLKPSPRMKIPPLNSSFAPND